LKQKTIYIPLIFDAERKTHLVRTLFFWAFIIKHLITIIFRSWIYASGHGSLRMVFLEILLWMRIVRRQKIYAFEKYFHCRFNMALLVDVCLPHSVVNISLLLHPRFLPYLPSVPLLFFITNMKNFSLLFLARLYTF
jgi:hypothetical protein